MGGKRIFRCSLGAAILFALQSGAPPALLAAATAISKTQDLSFGRFVGGAGFAGSVIIATSGARSATGGVLLLTSSCSAAGFTVTGNSGKTYTLTLPASFTVSSGTYQMTVSALTASIPLTGTLPANGTLPFTVGGTLTVTSTQKNQKYSGSLDVTVK